MRGYDYLQFVGQNVVFANAELRFPLIEAALTPIGVIGGMRGVFFADIGGGWFNNQRLQVLRRASTETSSRPIVDYQRDADRRDPVFDPVDAVCRSRSTARTQTVSGFRLQDGRASYGIGLETFALGFPIHFDWSWRTLFNKQLGRRQLFAEGRCRRRQRGFRKPRFAVWIGYDF